VLVDTGGLLLAVCVHPADLPDAVGGRMLLADLGDLYPDLDHLWADAGYRGGFGDWVWDTHGVEVEIVERAPKQVDGAPRPRFQVASRRWVVERTFAWMGRYRRMSRDYEYLPETQRANMHICMIFLMLQRLAYPS
jgi:putative transposase